MNRLSRWVVLLVALAMAGWGVVLVSLDYFGATAIPHDVSARRQGGDRGDVQFNHYNWSVHYEFRTRDGRTISGSATAIGSDHAVQTPKRIRYLPAFPYINAPADETGLGMMPLVLLTLGVAVMWALLRRRKPRAPGATSPCRVVPPSRLRIAKTVSDVDASPVAWLARYRANSRRYTWGFFAVISVLIGAVIRFSLDDWGTDWLYSTFFAVLLTAAFAYHSRRSAEADWVGVVESKEVTVPRREQTESGMHDTSYRVVFRGANGRKRTIRVSGNLYERYREGEEYRKAPGLNYPLPLRPDADSGFCPLCGADHTIESDACTQCGAPLLRLADLA